MTRVPMKTKLKRLYERCFCIDVDGPLYEPVEEKKLELLLLRLKRQYENPQEMYMKSFRFAGSALRHAMKQELGNGI